MLKNNFKTVFRSSVLLLAFSQAASATPLEQYRSTLPEYRKLQAADTDLAPAQLKAEILQKLTAKVSVPPALLDSKLLAPFNQEPRASFGNTLKYYLDMNTARLHKDQEFEKPTTINPRWSAEQSRQHKMDRKESICQGLLRSFEVSEMVSVLSTEAAKAQAGRSGMAIDPKQSDLLQTLNSAVGESIVSKLGPVLHFDVVNGVVNELHLSKAKENFQDENKLSISLPMLISARLGMDEHFVDSVGCLNKFFKEQMDTLEVRQSELRNEKSASFIRETQKKVDELYQDYQRDQSLRVRLTKDAFYRYNYMEMGMDQNAAAAYLLKRDNYLLGRNLSVQSELEMNQKHIESLKKFVPYFQSKYKGAKFAAQMMNQLTKQELDRLISLMIQLRGADLPGSKDIAALFSEAVKTDKVSVAADLQQYKILLGSLTDLKMSL